MKKFLPVIIASVILMSGCNNSELDNNPSSVPPSSESAAQTNGHSSAEISVNTSSDTPSTTAQSSTSSVSATSTVGSSTTGKLPESSSTAANNGQANEPPANKEDDTLNITITVNGRNFSAALYDNETAKAFKALLPLTLDMSELNGNEKYYYLPDGLPTNSSRPSKINNGDIMLYGSSCLVIFYESFSTSYSYTSIGKIDDPTGLAAALGSGGVQVSFNAEANN